MAAEPPGNYTFQKQLFFIKLKKNLKLKVEGLKAGALLKMDYILRIWERKKPTKLMLGFKNGGGGETI